MTKQHKDAFEKFDDFLALRQAEVAEEETLDIREKILAERFKPWNVGYVQENIKTAYAANLKALLPSLRTVEDKHFGDGGKFMILGTVYSEFEKSHQGAVRALSHYRQGQDLILFEQGFLASTHSWSEAFRQKNPAYACLGYVYDDIAHYFMADYPNRIIQRLNSKIELTDSEQARARGLIKRIVDSRISKYNSQPIYTPAMTEGYERRILVCDQSFADASTVYGKIDEAGFEQMLLAAIRENPDAEILIKTHPDTFWEKNKRTGYYNHLVDTGRIRILREPINPYCLFEKVDKVYVGTSGLGLEALFAGKEVVCFGAPFYAGWGLTEDRQPLAHRHRTRSLEEIFHFFYIWYTIYHVPGCKVPSDIEEVLDHIERNRQVCLPPTPAELAAPPKVSVILPVYGVEKYIEQCLNSIQGQTLREIEIIPVNDKSPDGSQAIIDRLAADDPRIRPIVLSENIGQGFARNVGIEAARGEYIFFVDSDDLLASPTVLADCVMVAEQDDVDMVRVQKRIFEDGKRSRTLKLDANERFFSQRRIFENAAKDPSILKTWHFWNFLYRKSLIDRINLFFVTPQWEERAFICRALLSSNRISSLPIPGVDYRKRSGSTVRRKRGLQDLENMTLNIQTAAEDFQNSPSLGYIGTQFAHILANGIWSDVVEDVLKARDSLISLERLARAFDLFDLNLDSFAEIPTALIPQNFKSGKTALFLTSLRLRDWIWVEHAIKNDSINQADLLTELLTEPADARAAAFQAALNHYARNDQVKVDKEGGIYKGPRPRIVIHVGATKTGSTYIQHFLDKNRPSLLRRGVWYPEVGLFWQQDRPHKQAGHSLFTPEANQGKKKLRNYIEAGLRLAKGQIHTIILSSEAYFLNRNSLKIADHFSGYPIEMIAYFRRQDDWANSQYAEFVAGGAMGRVHKPISDWLKEDQTRERLDYFSYLEVWANKIGRENIHARKYDRAAFVGGDIIVDFLTEIGLSDLIDLPRPTVRQANDFPFGTAHVKAIRYFNAMPWKDKPTYLRFINDVTVSIEEILKRRGERPGKVNLLSAQERLDIMESMAESNRLVAEIYFGLRDGVLFNGNIREASPESTNLSAEEIEVLFEAYHRHKPKAAVKNNPKAKRNIVGKKYDETYAFKAFRAIGGPMLSQRKRRKLGEKPIAFFRESDVRLMGLIDRVIRSEMERSKRNEPQNGSTDDKVKNTLTYRFVSTAVAPFLSEPKKRKLKTKPALFFEDIRAPSAKLISRLIQIETGKGLIDNE
ncbi:MAG: glycosyltransferase [Myxococcota bacterium]|nr:glycosyltransferase [Myxococcota bacterium]